MSKSDRAELIELRRRLGALEKRVAAFEAKRRITGKEDVTDEDDLAFLDRLRSKKGKRYGRDDVVSGVVAYAGAATISRKTSLWMREHPIPQILGLDQDSIARILMALGNHSRIAILIELIQRPRTGVELQELLKMPSTGQLYHHLKELLSAGIISQPKRSTYEVSVHKLIPLLNILGTTADFFYDYSEPESETGEVKQK